MEDKPTRKGAGGAKGRCRYGAECRNIGKGCKFQHPSPSGSGGTKEGNEVHVKKPKPKNKEKKDKSKIQCRYGMECRNTKCPFFHHPAAVPVSSPNSATTKDSPPKIIVANGANGNSPLESPSTNGSKFHHICKKVPDEQLSSPRAQANGKSKSVATTPTRGKATLKKKCLETWMRASSISPIRGH